MRRPMYVIGAAFGAICAVMFSYARFGQVPRPSAPAPVASAQVADPPSEADVSAPAPDVAPTEASTEAPAASQASCRAQVLVYHHVQDHFPGEDPVHYSLNVPPPALDRHFDLLKRDGYAVVPLSRLVECMDQGTPLPPKAVVLTFDDRWRTQYKHAAPRLEKHGFTATFFITTETNGPACMSWDDLRDLERRGMNVGSHSQTHPMLTDIAQDAVLVREIAASKERLTKELGHPVEHFAYPYGYSDKRVVNKVKEAGYRSARTVVPGHVHTKDDLFHVRAVQAPEDIASFKVMLERAFPPEKK